MILVDNPLFGEYHLCFKLFCWLELHISCYNKSLISNGEDFLESFQQSPEPALAELINLVLRSWNDSVDSDQAVDFDGIVSTLDDLPRS